MYKRMLVPLDGLRFAEGILPFVVQPPVPRDPCTGCGPARRPGDGHDRD